MSPRACGCSGAGHARPRSGLTIPEVLVVIAIVSMLIALLLPAVQASRERSRTLSCRSNLHQIGVAATSHAATQRTFPYTSTTWAELVGGVPRIYPPISPHRHLLAHLDSVAYLKIDFADPAPPWPNQVPSTPSLKNRPFFQQRVAVFQCPSDSIPAGGNSYRANLGISIHFLKPSPSSTTIEPISQTGAFVNGQAIMPDHFFDGTSNTVLFSEKVVGDGTISGYSPFQDRYCSVVTFFTADNALAACRDYATSNPGLHDSYAGFTWFFGGWNHTWYNHVDTPNSRIPDCSIGGGSFPIGGGSGLYTARSYHSGGVNCLMADGAVRFVANGIGQKIWRAIGTRNKQEIADIP